MALEAQTLACKGAGISMDVGRPVAIETGSFFAVYCGRHKIFFLSQGRGKIRRKKTDARKISAAVSILCFISILD